MREIGLGGEVWVVGPGGDVVGCSWCGLVVQRGYVRGSDSKIYGPCSLGHSAISSVASSVFSWGGGGGCGVVASGVVGEAGVQAFL